jgi:hypothetical protein
MSNQVQDKPERKQEQLTTPPAPYRTWLARPDGTGFWIESARPLTEVATEIERDARRRLRERKV